MLEVLITIVILAFGMLGLAGLQGKIYTADMESYQRAQAVVLMNDMIERINANRNSAASYVPSPATTTFGTGDTQPADCSALTGVAWDQCQWSNELKGAAEASGTKNVGAMVGARGCIALIQAQDATPGVCKPGIYMVSVAWQGLNPTSTPAASCAQNLFGNDDRFRRVVAATISIGLPSCQ